MFAKLQARYGHKWTSGCDGIEEAAVAEWAEELAGLTGQQIAHGLRTWKEDWPPSAPEFRRASTGNKRKNEFGMDYIPECYRQPPKVTDRRKILSSDERDARRAKAGEKIEELRKALNAGQ